MTVKPSSKRPRNNSESKWPDSELHWLQPHQRAVPGPLKDLLKALPSELRRSFETLHELLEKKSQAEMVYAYQIGMIVRFLLDRTPRTIKLKALHDHFVEMTKALGMKCEYLAQTCNLVDAFELPEFGALIGEPTMTWDHLRKLATIEARRTRPESVRQSRRRGGQK